MPRKRRRDESGAIHHATLHGVNEEFVFLDDEDRIGYLAMVAATVLRYRWHCLAYCLMGTHIHLLIETPEANYSDGMRWLHGHYARCFNRQHRRRGHLFQGRFHDEPILTEAHLINAAGYIPLNPVVAGLCPHPATWRWGSHHRVSRGIHTPWLAHERLTSLLDGIAGRGTYETLIATRLSRY